MANVRSVTIPVTTNASGAADVRSTESLNGLVLAVIYTKTDFADGVDFTITGAFTGQQLWVEDNVDAGRVHRPVAAAATPDGAASELSELPIGLCDEPVRVVVANGGNTKTGSFTVLVV